jgi:alpha-D-ribose 1-methylphosphonate 5-triphosphate diphosphatase PhnM
MARHHMTSEGKVAFTADEETARDAEEKAWADKAAERAWASLRQERDIKLANTDWMASSDVTLSDEWKKYRKDLRDFPATLDDAKVVKEYTWPSEPS